MLPERIASKIMKVQDGCWLWTASLDPYGYGQTTINGLHRGAHRVVYQLLVGPIPDGLTSDHRCRVRSCVNPDHMEVVTRGENVLRGEGPPAVNARKTHCIHGHEFTPENTITKRLGRGCRECDRRQQRARRERKIAHGV